MNFIKMSPLIVSKGAARHEPMLNLMLRWMAEELDRYIGETGEAPWFYNERAVLGFFISGLIRKGNAIVLQEFSSYKGKGQSKERKLGRADLYFQLNGDDYLVEAKWCCTIVNTRSSMDEATKWAKEALAQANSYAEDAKVKKNVFSLCFEVIFCAENNYYGYAKNIGNWKIDGVKDLRGLDYYIVVEAATAMQQKSYRYKNDLYPSFAIYGLFKRRQM